MTKFIAVKQMEPLGLKDALNPQHKNVDNYRPALGLKEAMDVAMLLGVPLLLTGEPGAGKTSAAAWLAKELNAGGVLRDDVKSTTSGRDLLYKFDEVARFRDSGGHGEIKPLIDYVEFSPLGEAIVRAAGGSVPLLGRNGKLTAKQIERAFGPDAAAAGEPTTALLLPHEAKFAAADGAHRVVLIDELDKAPRDTPNDLLAEIDDMEFVIAELSVRVTAKGGRRPIVLITSNSEKALPEPFLRRCAFFNVPEADDEELARILASAIPKLGASPLITSAIEWFRAVRRNPQVQKKPGTAELIACLDVSRHLKGVTADMTVTAACQFYFDKLPPKSTAKWPPVCALMKSDEDAAIAMGELRQLDRSNGEPG